MLHEPGGPCEERSRGTHCGLSIRLGRSVSVGVRCKTKAKSPLSHPHSPPKAESLRFALRHHAVLRDL